MEQTGIDNTSWTTIISGILGLLSVILTSVFAARQKRTDSAVKNQESDRSQNVKLVEELQRDRDYIKKELEEYRHKFEKQQEENSSIKIELAKLTARDIAWQREKELWQRERDTWQKEREMWQIERDAHQREKQAWHVERSELVKQVGELTRKLDALMNKE
jgi:golgin subfamily B member 1